MCLLVLVPIFLAVFTSTSIWTVFGVSVMNNSVNLTNVFPFISECAWDTPQKCMFSLMCSLMIITALWIGMVQFHQVKQLGNHGRVNNASAVMGVLSCGGLSVSCSFHESNMSIFHLVGILVSFISALAYFWMQVYLTYKGHSFPERFWMGPLRALSCTIATSLGIAFIGLHIINCPSGVAACEFALVMVLAFLYGLFAVEFRHIECHVLIVKKQSLQDENNLKSVDVNFSVVKAIS